MYTMPHTYVQQKMAQIIPEFRSLGGKSFHEWQISARAKLTELLCLPLESCDSDILIEFERDHDDFHEVRFSVHTEPSFRVPCHLLIPRGADRPLPVAICLQGHSKGMYVSLGREKYDTDEPAVHDDSDFCIRAVKEGFCAIAIEQRGFGELGGTENGPACANPAMTALLIGRTIIGERVWDVMRLVDALAALPFPQVDRSKVILMGNSGGGTTAFFTSCLDERIKYVMTSSYFCTFDDSIAAMRHCVCNYVPGIRKYFDMGDMAGMIAPRPLVIDSGRDDTIYPLHGVKKAYAIAQEKYAQAGAPENMASVVGDGGHRFYADLAWLAMKQYIGVS
ncbi:hypothetical protein FACS18948_2410 [Clostridia bacterium]|nr:hypothetical protein FACS18948_2410 [Clostridia bacterium]